MGKSANMCVDTAEERRKRRMLELGNQGGTGRSPDHSVSTRTSGGTVLTRASSWKPLPNLVLRCCDAPRHLRRPPTMMPMRWQRASHSSMLETATRDGEQRTTTDRTR